MPVQLAREAPQVARARVQTDFMAERRKEMNQSFLEELLSKYEIVIEGAGGSETENQAPAAAPPGGSGLTGGEP